MAAASPIAEPLVVVAGSNNPVKVAAVLAAFQAAFPGRTIACTGVSAASGVSDQPTGNDETRTGAYNRAQAVVEAAAVEELEPEFAVGLEGGVLDETWTGPSGAATQSMSCMAWMAVLHVPSGTWGALVASFWWRWLLRLLGFRRTPTSKQPAPVNSRWFACLCGWVWLGLCTCHDRRNGENGFICSARGSCQTGP